MVISQLYPAAPEAARAGVFSIWKKSYSIKLE
jgi:hypothetical protein